MIYRAFGKTDKQVSVLGFGGLRFLPELYSNDAGREKCAALVVKAAELGINYFDTAHNYCGNNSEIIFGIAFKQIKKNIYVSAKSHLQWDKTEDAVLRRIETELKTMGLSKIHFYNMWSIMNLEHYKNVMAPGGPYAGALKAKKEGLIEHICASIHANGGEIVKMVNDDVFEGITIGFNAMNFKYREEGVAAAYKKNIAVVTMNPLGGGVIPRNAEYFSFLKDDKNDSASNTAASAVANAALRFNAAHEGITVVLSGISNEDELLQNVKCFDTPIKTDNKKIDDIKKCTPDFLNKICTGCNYCKGCPQGIAVDKLMQGYNQFILSNKSEDIMKDEFGKWGFSQVKHIDCIECGECEKKCTQHLDITNRIKEANTIIDKEAQKIKTRVDKAIGNHGGDGAKEKIGLYAIGALALEFVEHYRGVYNNTKAIIGLFDGDKNKWGTEPVIKGIAVQPPDAIAASGIKRLIVCNLAHFDSIYKGLKHLEDAGITITKYEL